MSEQPADDEVPEPIPGMPQGMGRQPELPISDEARQYYDEISERIVSRLKLQKGRRSRWRPVD